MKKHLYRLVGITKKVLSASAHIKRSFRDIENSESIEPISQTLVHSTRSDELSEYELFQKKTLFLVFLALAGYVIWDLWSVVLIVVASAFLSVVVSPWLNAMNRRGIPDWAGILLIFLLLLILLALVVFSVIPIFVDQILLLFSVMTQKASMLQSGYATQWVAGLGLPTWLAGHVSSFLERIDVASLLASMNTNIATISSTVGENVKTIASQGVSIAVSFTNSLFQGGLVFVMTFFMVIERASVRGVFYASLPQRVREYVLSREATTMRILESWIRWQSVLALSIFITTYCGLWVVDRTFDLGLSSHFTLALIAGILEFLPTIGPFLAFLPALAVALGISGKAVLVIAVLYILIQQLENNVLVPIIMKKTLNLSPFLTLIAMIAWASVAGVLGILVSVPLAAIASMLWGDWVASGKRSKVSWGL